MVESNEIMSFNSHRRFGAEFEFCSFDNRDFKKYPLHEGELPEGIHDVASILMERLKVQVIVNKWHHTHNNEAWVLKPDSSAGIEMCSPVVKGWQGIKHVCRAIDAIQVEPKIKVDDRCGFHLHVEVSDCNNEEIGSILAHWIKCESVFLDSVPLKRKRNKYCQQIGLCPFFAHDENVDAYWLIDKLGEMKYYTINTFHLIKNKRRTIEFRIAEGEGCLDQYLIKNWSRLLLHFVERAKMLPLPGKYNPSNPWSGYLWLDLKDVMNLMGFDGSLSKGLEETRNWFLARIAENIRTNIDGLWSEEARQITQKQLLELVDTYQIKDLNHFLRPKDMRSAVYAPDTII
jgi:hypothetical protein